MWGQEVCRTFWIAVRLCLHLWPCERFHLAQRSVNTLSSFSFLPLLPVGKVITCSSHSGETCTPSLKGAEEKKVCLGGPWGKTFLKDFSLGRMCVEPGVLEVV